MGPFNISFYLFGIDAFQNAFDAVFQLKKICLSHPHTNVDMLIQSHKNDQFQSLAVKNLNLDSFVSLLTLVRASMELFKPTLF